MNSGDLLPGTALFPGGVTEPLLRVRHLSKQFPVRRRGLLRQTVSTVHAVNDLSLDLYPGETVGLVGESGSGKSTAARCIVRALAPSAGEILFRTNGRTVDLAGLSERALQPLRPALQLIFQDPFSSLNPRMTVGQIIGEPLVIHRLARGSELDDRVDDMLLRIGLKPEHRTRYPHAFSGGQRQRIGIARALIMHPSLLVADEAVSALDVSVQAQVLNLLKDLQQEFNLTCLLVAHNLDVVRHVCDRVAVMYAGRIVELAETAALFRDPRHPYTRALHAAMPRPDPDQHMSCGLAGEAADPGNLPSGCAFHPRCPECFSPCAQTRPELIDEKAADRAAGAAHLVACHLCDGRPPPATPGAAAGGRDAGLPGGDIG
jgi:oligopeptide/dipeptide ABC transporter ATP-binding protein